MKTLKTMIAALLITFGLAVIGPQAWITSVHAEDKGIYVEDEGEVDSSSVPEESVEGDSESYPMSDDE